MLLVKTLFFCVNQAGQVGPFIEKKSKFFGSASQISSEDEANSFIERIQKNHKRATHNCFAYRLQQGGHIVLSEDDDGEPSGTAGNSILYVLEKRNVVNTVIVVTRYSGGIKLGKGGLVRNYSKTASKTLDIIGISKLENKREQKKSNM